MRAVKRGRIGDSGSCLAMGYVIDRRGNEKLKAGGSGCHLTGLQVQYGVVHTTVFIYGAYKELERTILRYHRYNRYY
jgi:hypothetical protein